MTRRVERSHPDFRELFELADRIAKAKNPQRWYNGQKAIEMGDTDRPEWKADTIILEGEMADKLEGGLFRDFLNGMPPPEKNK